MSSIFDLIFDLFGWVVTSLRSIPLTENVSLFDFSFALIIMSITITAVVVTAKVGGSGISNLERYEKPHKTGFGADNTTEYGWRRRR